MFKLNLKIALRNIWKHKLTTSIKLTGLIVGLSCVVVLVAYVLYELSYDRHFANSARIYRIHEQKLAEGKESTQVPTGMTAMLKEELPEVEDGTVLNTWKSKIQVKENSYQVKVINTEHQFFEIFGVTLLAGDVKTALTKPKTMVLSKKMATILFPSGNAIGEQITMDGGKIPFQVVGVIDDIPAQTHFSGDVLINNSRIEKLNWRAYSAIPHYILLKKGANVANVESKLGALYKKYQFPEGITLKFMPLTKIHLYSHTDSELSANSDIKYIYIFSIAAIIVLFIALINYINLTVAAALKRSKEIGIKKVLGASIAQLRWQFLAESYIYFITATLLVLIVTNDVIPLLGDKLGISFNVSQLINMKTLGLSLALVVLSGFIAGFYPAIVLSRLMPVKTLKGDLGQSPGKFGFRKFLITFQFAASALLIVCTLIIYSQLKFISDKKLGFDKENILVSDFSIYDENFPSFKAALLDIKDVKQVTLSSFNPGVSYGSMSSWTNDNDTTKYAIEGIFGDMDFMKTLNIKVVKGRSFSPEYGSDLVNYQQLSEGLDFKSYQKVMSEWPILLNERAVKMLRLDNPIDSALNFGGLQGKVIGVVADFNGKSLHNATSPLVIRLNLAPTSGYMYVKVSGGNIQTLQKEINTVWKKHYPGGVSELRFLDDHLADLYVSEMRLGSVFITFAGITIFLCCIGLFGMVFFDLENRTKEIAVRKILGASVKDLLTLLNSGFVKIVLLANLLIWPLAYYLAKEWLNSFHYRIEVSYVPFLFALISCLLLTIITVSFQAIRTLRRSPVEALKYE